MAAQPGERLHRFETICGPRGGFGKSRSPLMRGRWTWCAGCLTRFDDYGTPVNPIPEFAKAP
jgi:hypothetical protein